MGRHCIGIRPRHDRVSVPQVAVDVVRQLGRPEEKRHPEHDRDAVKRLELANELHDAIDANELELYYQPKIDMQTGKEGEVAAYPTPEELWALTFPSTRSGTGDAADKSLHARNL